MRSDILIYNMEQKKEYIEVESSNQDSLINYFRRLYNKELEYQKDISDMNPDELKDTLESLNIRREETRGHILSLMRGYINWARLCGKTTNNSIINVITPESINAQNAIVSQMIKDPWHLEEILRNGIDLKDESPLMPNRATRDMLVFWLLYGGMSIEELSLLKKSDIDNLGVVTVGKIKYEMDKRVLPLWKSYASAEFIEKRNGKASKTNNPMDKDTIVYELIDNDYLFRVIRGKKEKTNKSLNASGFASIILNMCSNYSKATGVDFKVSPFIIKLSGIFYKMLSFEANGEEVTPSIVADFIGINYTDKADLLLKTRKWRKDYENWKLAFGHM